MRTRSIWSLSFVLAAASLAACAAPEGDDAEGQESNVTGGSSAVESPVVYLFESAAADAMPKCAGAILDEKIAVTAKACAKEGLIVGRAADKDGHAATRARITKVFVPEGADADIAVIELDRAVGGTRAVLTHMPLRAGYSVNAVASADGQGFFSPDKGEAAQISASMIEETATHGILAPKQGSAICDGDLGAPVCSSSGAKIAGYNIMGTCGLSGLVVGRADAAANANANANEGASCSNGKWKVAQLGRYADFLREHAPKAFEPLRIDKPILRNFPYAPEGLWGYETGGDVTACTLNAATLSPITASNPSAKITAKVAFGAMEKRAAAWGRFGIAKKSAPKEMRWLPAKALGSTKGQAFEAGFEGIVSALEDGDYIVAFRASANGGETWVQCDTDGIANGFSEDKTLALRVGLPEAPPETAPPAEETAPQDTTPSTDPGEDYSDPYTDSSEDDVLGPSEEGEDDDIAVKKGADSGGCSASGTGTGGASSSLAAAGLCLGLAFAARRRRSAAK